MLTNTFALQGLMPAHRPDLAVKRPVHLPYGGPYGTTGGGGTYATGLALGLVPGTIQSEVFTLTIGTSTGVITNYLYADKVYVVTHDYNATLAVVKAAWEAVFGVGNVTVTGTAGSSYVVTLGGSMANKRLGCYLTQASNGNASWARTTRGNCGAGQYDVYDGSGVTTIDAILMMAVTTNPQGGRVTDQGSGSEQPFAPPAYMEGFFNYADIPNIATAAIGNDKKLGYATGSASLLTGAIVRLSQKN